MTVPFETLGNGQVGRLVFQVLGKDGPIFNPSNIRYLPPNDYIGEFTSVGAGPLLGLSGLGLAATCGVLAMQAYTLQQIAAVHQKLDRIEQTVDRIEAKVDTLLQRVERIDTKMAESHLRSALDHALARAVRGSDIHLPPLFDLVGDIQSFEASTERPLLLNFGVDLSSDVRSRLTALLRMLRDLRIFVAYRHNKAAFERNDHFAIVAASHSLLDVETVVSEAVAWSGFMANVAEGMQGFSAKIYTDFTFADEEYCQQLGCELMGTVIESSQVFGDSELPGWLLWQAIPAELEDPEKEDELRATYTSIVTAWEMKSDAALLLKTQIELEALRDGYETVFYTDLANHEMSGATEPFTEACDVSKMAA